MGPLCGFDTMADAVNRCCGGINGDRSVVIEKGLAVEKAAPSRLECGASLRDRVTRLIVLAIDWETLPPAAAYSLSN